MSNTNKLIVGDENLPIKLSETISPTQKQTKYLIRKDDPLPLADTSKYLGHSEVITEGEYVELDVTELPTQNSRMIVPSIVDYKKEIGIKAVRKQLAWWMVGKYDISPGATAIAGVRSGDPVIELRYDTVFDSVITETTSSYTLTASADTFVGDPLDYRIINFEKVGFYYKKTEKHIIEPPEVPDTIPTVPPLSDTTYWNSHTDIVQPS